MSTVLALIATLILIAVRVIRKKKSRSAVKPVLVRRYVHPGHTWVRLTDDGYALVGMDDLAQSVIGTIDEVKLPRLLRRVEQGGVAWFVWHGLRIVPMVSPVTGRVVEKNEMVMNNPSLINASPYNDGWLFKVRPLKIRNQLQNLFTGRAAHQWQDAAKVQLGRLFSGTPALMYQDGGVLLNNLTDRCSDEEWNELARQFFLVCEKGFEKDPVVKPRRRTGA
jgi:glycine cleavage system H protein